MSNKASQRISISSILCSVAVGSVLASPMTAQGTEMQQRVADLKEAMAKNNQELAQYTWNEQVTTSLKGEEKKQEGDRQAEARRSAAIEVERKQAKNRTDGDAGEAVSAACEV